MLLAALMTLAGGRATAGQSQPGSASAEIIKGSPALSIIGLRAEAPLPGERIEGATYTRELIRVQWRYGDPLDLYVIRPKGVAEPPAILFLYGFPSETDRFRGDTFCTSVTAGGYAAVGFVSALTGARFHDRPMKQWFVSELAEALTSSVQDVQMILDYLATRGDVDMHRIGIYGQGSGGAIAILSATVDARLQAVDLMDPWADWPEWLALSSQVPDAERATYLAPAFLEKVAPLDPLHWLPRLADRPVRVQESLFNPTMPPTVRSKVLAAIPPSGSAVEYATLYDYKRRVAHNAKMLDWLHEELTNPRSLGP